MNQAPNTFGYLLFGGGVDPWWMVFAAIVSAIIGMISHWGKIVYKDGDIIGFLEYFFVKNTKATMIATGTMLAGLFAAFAPVDYTTLTMYQVVMQAFTIGYGADSIFNSGATKDDSK